MATALAEGPQGGPVGWWGEGEGGGAELPFFQTAPLPIINCGSRDSYFSGSSQRTSLRNLIKPESFSTSIIRNTQFTQVIRPPNYNPMFLLARFPPGLLLLGGLLMGPGCWAAGPEAFAPGCSLWTWAWSLFS